MSAKFTSLLVFANHGKNFNKFYKEIQGTENTDYNSLVNNLTNIYVLMKELSAEVGSSPIRKSLYERYRRKLFDCENLAFDYFIVSSEPEFIEDDNRYINADFNTLSNEEKLKYIVWNSRKLLLKQLREAIDKSIDFSKCSLINQCERASIIVDEICRHLGVKSSIMKILPAYTNEIELYNGSGFHFFVLIVLEGKTYIVDCTYRQFFTLDINIIERLGIMGIRGCNPGVYMLQNESRKNTALNLLKHGFLEVTDENLKNYLDGFTLSFRNGLYYDRLGEVDYNVDYTVDQYLDFLNGLDSMLNYEDLDCLGEQEYPLQNFGLSFRKNE